jgi:AraC family ethanolamine operon transcriptional activator
LAPPNRFRYSSVEELQSALSSIWDVEITQSDRGPLDGSLNFRQLGECLVFGSQSNRSLVCAGLRSRAHWIMTPVTADCSSGYYRGQQLDVGDLLLLDPAGEVFQRTMPGHSQNAVSIPLPLAERIVRAEYQLSPQELWQRWCVKPDRSVSLELDRVLKSILLDPPAWSSWHSGIDLAAQLIALVQGGAHPDYPEARAAFRHRIVARAEELIRSRLDDPPSITELCEVTFASRRALFYAFRDLLGRSPSAHVKILRLHAARRRIVRLRHQRCVQQVAFELGFNHPGQFAIDYSRLFGELPSETRRQAVASVPKRSERRIASPPDRLSEETMG